MKSARFDEYSLVQDAISSARSLVHESEDAAPVPRLTVVAFIDKWAKPAMAVASSLEAIRMHRDVERFARLFIIETNCERDKSFEFGIASTPAIVFFWGGRLVTVRRPDWDDDKKLVGALSQETLLEVLRHARECCANNTEGDLVLSLDF